MGIIGGDMFIDAVHQFRNIWIRGRYGGGKTLLAVAIAKELERKYGYYSYSNIPVFLDETISELKYCDGTHKTCDHLCKAKIESEIEAKIKAGEKKEEAHGKGKYHTAVIYDEAWLSLGTGTPAKTLKAYLAYLRKTDVILIMPSVMKISKDGFLIWATRTFNWGVFGIPLWVYEWGTAGGTAKKTGGKFGLWMPQKYFGTYDTNAQPDELPNLFKDV